MIFTQLTALDLFIFQTTSKIVIQAAFSSTGPEPLYEILLNAGFDEPHAKVRVHCNWLILLIIAQGRFFLRRTRYTFSLSDIDMQNRF